MKPLSSKDLVKKAILNNQLEEEARRLIEVNPYKNEFKECHYKGTQYSISKLNSNVIIKYKFKGGNYKHFFGV